MSKSTTFIENGYKPDSLHNLWFCASWWAGSGLVNPVYILAIDSENKSLQEIKEFEDLKNDRIAYQVYKTLDLIIGGEEGENLEEEAKQLAEKIYKKTKSRVAIVKYEGQDQGRLYADLRYALRLTKRIEKKVHLYFLHVL